MRRLVGVAFIIGAFAVSTPALADVQCVQQGLTDLGFDPGPVDGALGKRTVKAATVFAHNAGLTIEPLTKDNSGLWCTEITAFAQTPAAATISALDLFSPPEGVLSDNKLKQLWDGYKTVRKCLTTPVIAPGFGRKIPLLPEEQFAETAWSSPFTGVQGAAQCTVAPPGLRAPAVISRVDLSGAYGTRLANVDSAVQWFNNLTAYHRLSGDPVASSLLREALVDWAEGDGFGRGIHTNIDTVDYQIMAAILSLTSTAADVAADFTPEQRAVVGPWLNELVRQVGDSAWKYRTDNKPYMRSYLALLWGLLVDDDKAVQEGIEEYKLAIHDMRPDGSWPIDSQRGAAGLNYQANSTVALVKMALALKTARNLDLFAYEVDGRSIHNAMDWVANSIKDPIGTNSIYAISCPDSGDSLGTKDGPQMIFAEDYGSLLAYALNFPERESSRLLRDHFDAQPYRVSDVDGGAAACYFALQGGDVDLEPLVPPPPLPKLATPKVVVHSVESNSNFSGDDARADTLIKSEIEGAQSGKHLVSWNIMGGGYKPATGEFSSLYIVINRPIDDKAVDAIKACRGRTDFWDDKHHPLIDIWKLASSTDYEPIDSDCIVDALSGEPKFMLDFLNNNIVDIAIGMAVDGTLDQVQHNGVREFLRRLAYGEAKWIRK